MISIPQSNSTVGQILYKVAVGKSSGSQASPGKRIHQRSECIDQLKKLHELMEDGIVSEEQYKEMHKKILADIQWWTKKMYKV